MVSTRANDTVPTDAATDDQAPVGPPLRLVEGQRIGPYRVIRYLGSGAMGVVYEAVDDDLAERVAIKTLLRADPWRLFRLKHEFRALAGVRHANLVRHDELTVASDTWFFAMEYVDGVDLVSDHRGAPARLRASLAQLVAGVQALHDAGVLHLDLKPANILVDRSGRVVILDFGLADFRDTAHASPRGHIPGTPGYIAPERLGGAAPEPASDWYAVGVILFELLVGRLPGAGGRPSAYVTGVPQDLDDLCDELLASDPAARPTGAEIVHRLGSAPVSSFRHGTRAPLLGRTAEIAALSRAIADASPGRPGLVRVSGTAGVGKSHFVRHVLDTLARADDLLVLSGRCYECESVPYGGMDTVIDTLARRVPSGLAANDEISEAAALFPVLSARLGRMTRKDADPEDRPAAFRGVRSLLARVAGPRPVVLFLDDLHYAGADTAALLLDLLVARDDGLVMTIVATFRSDREDASVCLRELDARAQVRGQKFSELRIALPTLDQDTCETLVRWHLGDGDGSRIAELARQSGGSPFLAELLTSEATAAVDVLTELVRRRIDGLPEASRMLLAVVALAGQPVSQGALLRAAPVEQARAALAALRARTLVRAHGTRRWDLVEVSHDRIAAGVLDTLTGAHRTQLHSDLAHALAQEGGAPPERLVRHWRGAGEFGRALDCAREAAGQAEAALAFERAASLLADAAEWSPTPDLAAPLYLRRGHALARAGRSADAAEAFLAAATTGPSEAAAGARQLAADALMAAGHIDRGLHLLQPMLAAQRLSLPRSPLGAGLALVWNYAKLRLRGVAAAPVAHPAPQLLQRSDLCWSLGMGLTNVMPIEGMLFAVRGLLAALASGEPARIGRGLAVFGAFHRLLGDATSSAAYLRRARNIAEERGDAALLGLVHISSAADALLSGAWHDVVLRTREGLAALAPRGNGMTWERVIGACFELTALDQLGQLAEVERRASEHLRDAAARGDLYGQIVFSQFLAQARVAGGDLASARQHARHGLDRWTRHSFTLQHFYALRVEVTCDLYEGDATRALAHLMQSWRAIEKAGLLRNPISRIDALLLRARCALATGDRRHALAMARRLTTETRPDVPLHVRWIRARAGHNPAGARNELRAAAAEFTSVGMDLHAACLAFRAAADSPPDPGDPRVAAIVAAGVRDPAAWLRCFVP